MLKGDFFTASDLQSENSTLKAVLHLNVNHKIFEGHFPGQPVVPGVCMMQMVKEMLEQEIGKPTRLEKALNMKFLTMISPLVNDVINIEINYAVAGDEKINVDAHLYKDDLVFFKFKGVFVANTL